MTSSKLSAHSLEGLMLAPDGTGLTTAYTPEDVLTECALASVVDTGTFEDVSDVCMQAASEDAASVAKRME